MIVILLIQKYSYICSNRMSGIHKIGNDTRPFRQMKAVMPRFMAGMFLLVILASALSETIFYVLDPAQKELVKQEMEEKKENKEEKEGEEKNEEKIERETDNLYHANNECLMTDLVTINRDKAYLFWKLRYEPPFLQIPTNPPELT